MSANNLKDLNVDGLVVIVGLEYSSPDGDFILLGTPEGIAPHMSARELLSLVKAKGGVAIAAHPCRIGKEVARYVFEESLCPAIEVLNGGNLDSENLAAQKLFSRFPGLIGTGGGDAHAVEGVGRALTRFHVPVRNEAELIAAIKTGQCEATAKGVKLESTSATRSFNLVGKIQTYLRKKKNQI
jgi:hypothetical protein